MNLRGGNARKSRLSSQSTRVKVMLTTTLFRRTIPKLSYGFITHPIHLRPAPFSSYYSCLSSHIPLAFDHFTPPPSSAKTTDRANPEILKSVNSDHQVVSSSVHQNHPNEWNKPIHQPILILHGLFGSRQNWRTLAKKLAHKSQREVFVLVSDQQVHFYLGEGVMEEWNRKKFVF